MLFVHVLRDSAARVLAAHRRIYFRTSKRPPFHVVTVMKALAPRRVSSRVVDEESPGIIVVVVVVVPKYRSEQIMRRVTNALNCTSTARSFGNASRKRANKLREQKRDSLSSISVFRLTRCVCTCDCNELYRDINILFYRILC